MIKQKSNKKVIYDGFGNIFSVQIVKHLQDTYDWEPVFMCGIQNQIIEKYLSENEMGCVLQDSMKLRQAQFDYSRIGKPVPIDSAVINALSNYVVNFLGVLHDKSGWDYSFEERKSFYYDILMYWNTVITNMKPDIAIFFSWPHTSSCYPLYLLCKHWFNIETLFIDPNPLFDRNYHYVGTSLEKLHSPFIDIYESNDVITPGDDVKNYLSKVRGDNAIIPKYITDGYIRDKKTKRKLYYNFILLLLSTCKNGGGFKKAFFEYKKNKKNYASLASRMNRFEALFFGAGVRRKNIRLIGCYNKFCIEPNCNKKYLYFASSYQPEANTATNAGAYEQLFLALDILSASVPEDWVIYYKEHPATFLEGFKGSLKRNKMFYEKVASYNNIKIISADEDTFKLITNSQAVSTVAGTIGWEAVVRNTPVLAFGSTWYQGCKSVFTISSLNDAKQAIKKISEGYLPDANDIERYAASVEKVAVKGIIHDNFHQEISRSNNPEYEMKRIADFLYDGYNQNYG